MYVLPNDGLVGHRATGGQPFQFLLLVGGEHDCTGSDAAGSGDNPLRSPATIDASRV
jgi:hypothetical protein